MMITMKHKNGRRDSLAINYWFSSSYNLRTTVSMDELLCRFIMLLMNFISEQKPSCIFIVTQFG